MHRSMKFYVWKYHESTTHIKNQNRSRISGRLLCDPLKSVLPKGTTMQLLPPRLHSAGAGHPSDGHPSDGRGCTPRLIFSFALRLTFTGSWCASRRLFLSDAVSCPCGYAFADVPVLLTEGWAFAGFWFGVLTHKAACGMYWWL